MRLVCMHADTVDALKRLSIRFDDLTPTGLWSSQYHLIGLTADQADALEMFQVELEDVTPAQLIQAVGQDAETSPAATGPTAASRPAQQSRTSEPTPGAVAGAMAAPGAAQALATEPVRATGAAEAEVPLAQTRDGGARAAEVRPETKPEGKPAVAPQATQLGGSQATGGQQQATGQKNAGTKAAAPSVTPPAQAGRKGQPQPASPGGSQRYGTTRLRISVAGKYTEATVANGKIVVGGRTFDSPDQAAAELTKSRGDWTFWEYYDSADGKWRMLTRDWDTVLKSAAPGGR